MDPMLFRCERFLLNWNLISSAPLPPSPSSQGSEGLHQPPQVDGFRWRRAEWSHSGSGAVRGGLQRGRFDPAALRQVSERSECYGEDQITCFRHAPLKSKHRHPEANKENVLWLCVRGDMFIAFAFIVCCLLRLFFLASFLPLFNTIDFNCIDLFLLLSWRWAWGISAAPISEASLSTTSPVGHSIYYMQAWAVTQYM